MPMELGVLNIGGAGGAERGMRILKNAAIFLAFLFMLSHFFSCASSRHSEKSDFTGETKSAFSEITLLFAGDVMAHKPNFNMKDYKKIWEGVFSEIQGNDIAFANIEAPVDDSLPWQSYPTFNMHSDYVGEAINAGFSVFSLVNNHSNDQGLGGIKNTIRWSSGLQEKTRSTENPLYFSGLRHSSDAPFSFCLIEKDGWRILFVAVTEILNAPDYKSYLNYTPYTVEGRKNFADYIKILCAENPCDIFVVSIHTDEAEYVAEVKQTRRDYYELLLESGADVIWANHPHIIREREIYGNSASGNLEKIVMYGNGNTISGQRWQPQLENPMNAREDTGDGLMLRVTFSKSTVSSDKNNIIIEKYEPVYITTYINDNWEFVIRNLDDEFITDLKNSGKNKWASYMQARKNKAWNTKETIIWK